MKAYIAFALLAIIAISSNAAPDMGVCQMLGNYPPPGRVPDRKSCSNCQWQALTDPEATGIIFDNVTYSKNFLATWNCGDGRWLNQSLAFPSPGIGVFFNASGAIIDTQEQGCFESAHQCRFWPSCTGFAWRFVLVAKENGDAYCGSVGAVPQGSGR